jgi:hypothetical protein
VPRIINVIGDATLLFAYGLDRRGVDQTIAQEALAELDATGVLASYQSEGERAAVASSFAVSEAAEAMRLADSVRRREHEMVERERQLRDREQAITAQQRIVEEQARLLASHSARTGSATATAEAPVRAVPALSGRPSPSAPGRPRVTAPEPRRATADGRQPVTRAVPAHVRVQSAPAGLRNDELGWWGRLRRVLFGADGPGARA